jgi:hypothetical protein
MKCTRIGTATRAAPGLTVFALNLASAMPAMAQTPAGADDALTDVVVTARRVEERSQDV